MKPTAIIASAIIALGLLALGLCIRSGIDFAASRDRTVDVRGLAEREVPANVVTWPIMFKEVGNSLPTVYANVSATNQRIVDFLKANGITDQEISIGAPKVQDLTTDRYNNQPLPYNYAITSVVTVSSGKVKEIHALINRQGELFAQGIAITNDYNYQITYDFTDLNSIKPEMIAEATKKRPRGRQEICRRLRIVARQDQDRTPGTVHHRRPRRHHTLHQESEGRHLAHILSGRLTAGDTGHRCQAAASTMMMNISRPHYVIM